MATLNTKTIRWSALRGMSLRDTPQNLPPDIGTDAVNVDLLSDSLGRRRPSAEDVAVWLSPDPDDTQICYIAANIRTIDSDGFFFDSGTDYLLVFSQPRLATGEGSGALALQQRGINVGGAVEWDAITLIDPVVGGAEHWPCVAVIDQNVYGSWRTSEQRMYLLEPGASTVRRVGIAQPAAPTAADTGSGSYAATARYYRVSMRKKDGSDITAESELSSALSFTPSGSGSAARITKPATVDSASHWVVWGLIGTAGDTYDLFEELAEIAVGTTTYDDSTAPASYDGDFPDPLGLNVPPADPRYIVTDGNRLVFAGSFVLNLIPGFGSRVSFTRVKGSSDRGDLESVPNTTTLKYFVDVGDGDGDVISGLSYPMDGIIYVFKHRSIYRMIPTGEVTTPYRVEKVSTGIGANVQIASIGDNPQFGSDHRNIVSAQDEHGQACLYFVARAGAHRISPSRGIEFVGWDVSDPDTGLGPEFVEGRFLTAQGMFLWLTYDSNEIYTYTPRLARLTDQGWRGGWARYDLSAMGFSEIRALCVADMGVRGAEYPVLGGNDASAGFTARIVALTGEAATDDGTAFTASVTSKPFLLGGGSHRALAQPPIVEAEVDTDATPTISYIVDWGRETQSGATTSLSAVGSETRKVVKAESCQAADAAALQVKVTWDSDQIETIDAVTVPYVISEPI